MFYSSQRRLAARTVAALGLIAFVSSVTLATQPDKADALDQQILAAAKKDSQIVSNLTYLSDMIGPRLTGSDALRRANEWGAEKMKAYGLVNVHQEPWLMPEGWQRGTAMGRMLEPDNGRSLSLASYGWHPGTNGKVQGDVVILKAATLDELNAYKGRLKGAIVLDGAPKSLTPVADIEKQPLDPQVKKGGFGNFEERMALMKAKTQFLQQEGVVAILTDAGKHHGLLFTTGGFSGTERPSATRKIPMLAVAH